MLIIFQIFFVLRKKNRHISTLHVIHHGIMPMSVWFGVKFTPGGHSTFFGFLNTFVHIIMYTYYFLAALGPQWQKYLWWKKYLTAIQMVWNFFQMERTFFSYDFNNFRYNSYWLWFTPSNYCLSIAIIRKHLFGGLACMLLCSISYFPTFTKKHTPKGRRPKSKTT